MSTTPNYQQTLEVERKETPVKSPRKPRNLDHKSCKSQAKTTRTREREPPPPPPKKRKKKKKGGSKTRTSALKPKPEQTPKEKTHRRIGCDKKPRGQNAAADPPRELNPQE